jgi:hypothetical protein
MIQRAVCFSLAIGGFLILGQGPPKFFELEVPEFQNRVFDSDVVELPVQNLSKLVIHVLNPVADKVSYGKIYPKLNGDAASIICQYRGSDRGKDLYMDLKMRPDLRLLPGTNTLEITVEDQRRRRYYKNWILRTREVARNEWFAYDYSLAPSDEAAAAPDLVVTEPQYPVVLENDRPVKVRVKGTAEGVHPIVKVLVNRRPSPPSFEQELTVSTKDTQIVVEATDEKGNHARVTVPIVNQAKSIPVKFSGDRYALVIGISRYKNRPGGPPNAYAAASDAESFAAALKRSGVTNDHMVLLQDEKATFAQIRNSFRNFVASAKRDDLLIVFFDGYALHDPHAPDKIYLAAHDTNSEQLSDTALELEDLQLLLGSNVRSHNALFLFDVSRDPGADWSFAGRNLASSYLLKIASKEQGRAVMVSASVNQYSREVQSAGSYHGVFTRWMDEALDGKADWNHDHLVTAAEFFRYVVDQVRAETSGAQVPRYELADLNLPLSVAH